MDNQRKLVYLRGHHLKALGIFDSKGEEEVKRRVMAAGELYGKTKEEKIALANALVEILKNILTCDVSVKIIDTIDDICAKCRNKDSLKCKYKASLDDCVMAAACGLEINKIYSSEEIRSKVRQKMFADELEEKIRKNK